MIGERIPRVEDERFLRGEGRFVADLKLPFMAEATILRSPHSHARIGSFDACGALASEGVVAVVSAADLPPDLPAIPCRIPTHGDLEPYLQHVLASSVVRYVGEPVAVVVAESRALAEDAAERIQIDWDPLPPVCGVPAALAPDAPAIHPAGNRAAHWRIDLGRVEDAVRTAAVTVSERFTIQRHTAMPLETRGLLASYDRARGLLEIFGPTKVPHTNRGILAAMLGLSEGALRLAEPDVGGSFGVRGEFYPEDFLIPWLAMRLKRPVRWIEDRFEHFAAINHSRQSSFEVTAAADAEGRLTALDVKLVADMGSYIRTHGDVVPSHASAFFPGPYRLRNYRCDASAVMTNKTPTGTMRAPGMFEANFARERIMDRLAAKLGCDPAEFRRRNLIPAEEMPWHVGTESVRRPTIFDSGNFPLVYDKALAAAGWDEPLPPGTGPIRRGRGLAVLVEPSGLGPFEGARVEIDAQGFVQVTSGSSNQGQGHETSLAQVAAQVLDLPIALIRVRHGDTALIPYGGGSYASRTAVLAGNAVHAAATAVRQKAIRAAARKLEIAEQDLTFADGQVHLTGAPNHGLALAAIARMLQPGNPELLPPPSDAVRLDHDGLTATVYVRGVPSGTCVFAVHMAEVAVDIEIGQVKVERYFVACDVGRAINPMIVEGQIVGGVVQGLGGALLEELAYDSAAQLQTGTFADYLIPSVHDAPAVEVLVLEVTPAASNELGVKGVGEVGPSGVAAAIGNAVARALGLETGIVDLPITPERVLTALAERKVT
jgi:aerobic carbon-monoxide dehydrogenase large subunit